MAATSSRKTSSSRKSTAKAGERSKGNNRAYNKRKELEAYQAEQDSEMFHEIGLIVLFVAALFLFCCNFGIIGPFGSAVSGILFGVFGLTAYIAPVLLFFAAAFWFANEGSPTAVRKLAAGTALFLMLGVVCDLFAKGAAGMEKYDVSLIYTNCSIDKKGGGVLAGSLAYLLDHYLGVIGTVLVVLLCSVISAILLTEKSLISSMKSGGDILRERTREDARKRRENAEIRRQEQAQQRIRREEERARREEERRLRAEEKENEKILRMEKKVTGVMLDTTLKKQEDVHTDDIHEITYSDITYSDSEDYGVEEDTGTYGAGAPSIKASAPEAPAPSPILDFEKIHIRSAHQVQVEDMPFSEEMPSADGRSFPNEMPFTGIGSFPGETPFPEKGTFPDEMPFTGKRSFPGETPFPEEGSFPDEMPFTGKRSFPGETPFPEEEPFPDEIPPGEGREPVGAAGFPGGAGLAGEEYPSASGSMGAQDITQFGRIRIHKEDIPEQRADSPGQAEDAVAEAARTQDAGEHNTDVQDTGIHKEAADAGKKAPAKYIFPPLSRLQKGKAATGDSARELKETAMRLQQTLSSFGVKVTITDISQGPSVTRYELQPEQGVKVSKIVGLSDDIKLNLAATDIRIEAPIPGKAAIGIEVPNKENMAVALRDLLESREFKSFPSNLAFAVGKDIAGKVVVADIARMPHMLIAGATGSGKSVCINTLIMSILYKAHPDDVKLIMVDPKVVELNVYNGIPHLLIPVVTDPKKASAALHWGVTEMEDRYRKFAELNVRDLKGYNEKVAGIRDKGDEPAPAKLPQIVIIVDELADLMMVSPGEVEESICRLAQLARACGIHLIIATQRPSVDVITGLIKANMPSRVAFSVSSGVDSRTILDMNGAEKLLGKGDMLFYPQGYSKPARVQGAFVSDGEVSDVVDFLKNQTLGNVYAEDIEEKIQNIGSPAGGAGGGGSARDEYFAEAGRFIIDKDKASIGMLQRALKVGFNRAARIMDQLSEYGVVGEEEGTKPRKILMSMEQFEQLLEEI